MNSWERFKTDYGFQGYEPEALTGFNRLQNGQDPFPAGLGQAVGSVVNNLNPMSWIGGVAGAVGDIVGTIWSNNKQEKLLREQWNREDTAYQRQAADLKAAGFNPNLVSGSGASSTAPHTVGSQNPAANFGGHILQAQEMYMNDISSRIQLNNSMALNLLRYAELEAKNIANSFAPSIAKKKIQTMVENLGLLEKDNDFYIFGQILKAIGVASRFHKKR